ncbi:LysR substrate-binding domain-containing protein [Pikeienuella sp. HZG-20]|uniref:LysR substrate-binding domain-containing protein n=1 Tax=Paludibacillus litoralis TaxID=3133267 RepID=UPI0030EB38A6
MAITLRQLRYFLALYEHRHFGKAAHASAVSQPALSVQVKALEAALGGALIDRAAKGVAPTALGHEIAAQARRVVQEAEALVRIARAERGVEGPFSLGLIPTIAPYLLPLALDLIARRLPLLELRVREAKTDELIAELKDGRLDAVVVASPPQGRDLSGRLLFRDRFLLAVNRREAAEKGLMDGAVRIEEVAKMRLLLLDEGHCLRDQALSVCNLTARDATEQMGASSMATILRLVAGGYGATLAPETAYDESRSLDQLQLIRLTDPQPEREIWFLSHRSRDMAPPYAALSNILAEAGADRLLNARRAAARALTR